MRGSHQPGELRILENPTREVGVMIDRGTSGPSSNPSNTHRDRTEGGVVGRLAPSPTGRLHLGHARTFLIAWLMARASGGRVVFRTEDLDSSRVRPGMDEGAMSDLRWIGLDWDEGPDVGGPSSPYVQSERLALYAETLENLKRADLVYPCTCSKAEIRRMASAPHAGEDGPIYPGTCAGRTARDAEDLGDRPFSWRFRVGPEVIPWDDLFKGPIASDPSTIVGDFPVGRSDGVISYQLSVVVDDAMMGITQVIRGDDLVSSTPRQLLLYRAIDRQAPRFGHVPLVVDPEGRRLAKRDESITLASLKDRGVDPGELMSEIGRSLGLTSTEGGTPRAWIDRFRPELLPPAPVSIELFSR